jgi:hypothetical protein
LYSKVPQLLNAERCGTFKYGERRMPRKKEQAYWEFHLRVGTDKPVMLTKEMIGKLSLKIFEIPEVVSFEIKEQYETKGEN